MFQMGCMGGSRARHLILSLLPRKKQTSRNLAVCVSWCVAWYLHDSFQLIKN